MSPHSPASHTRLWTPSTAGTERRRPNRKRESATHQAREEFWGERATSWSPRIEVDARCSASVAEQRAVHDNADSYNISGNTINEVLTAKKPLEGRLESAPTSPAPPVPKEDPAFPDAARLSYRPRGTRGGENPEKAEG